MNIENYSVNQSSQSFSANENENANKRDRSSIKLKNTLVNKEVNCLFPDYSKGLEKVKISPNTSQRPSKRISKKKTPYRVDESYCSLPLKNNSLQNNIDGNDFNLEEASNTEVEKCVDFRNEHSSTRLLSFKNEIKDKIIESMVRDDSVTKEKYNAYNGERIAKKFKKKVYLGTVQEELVDEENGSILYHIKYDDGDEEDIDNYELQSCLKL